MDTDKATYAEIALTNIVVTTDGEKRQVKSGEIYKVDTVRVDQVLLEAKNGDKFYMSINDVLILKKSASGDLQLLKNSRPAGGGRKKSKRIKKINKKHSSNRRNKNKRTNRRR